MSIAMTDDFAIEHIKYGTSPVLLVELQTAGEFYATREPGFVGNWTAGDGLLAGSGILAGDPYPAFDTILAQIQQGGIGTITQSYDTNSGVSLTGNTSVQILNQLLESHITDDYDLTNARIRIRLGFFGQTWPDYITVFQGAVEEFDATLLMFNLSCIDDSLVTLKPLPPQTGADFLPRASTVGRAIPIILGDVDLVPAIPIVDDVTATLFRDISSGADEIEVVPVTSPFPPSGEITIDAEVIQYGEVSPTVIAQQQVLQFRDLTRSAPVAHTAGADVTLTSFAYQHLIGFEARDLRRIRTSDNDAPATPVTVKSYALDPEGNDARRITVLETDTADEVLTATVAGENTSPNLIVNGEGNADPATVGWTPTAGSWTQVTFVGENAIRGRVLAAQGIDSELVQDITTTDGELMRLTGTITLDATNTPPFATIRIGTPAAPSSVFDFGQITNTFETGVDLTFRAPTGGTTRITLVVDSSTPGTPEDAYFDHLVCYSIETENPASQIEYLINNHMRNIKVDRISFDEASEYFSETVARMAGVLDTTQEAQTLLGRLAYQYKCKTFFDESGKQKLVYFDNARTPVTTISEDDIQKGTMHYELEPEEKIKTNFYVYFNRRADVSQGNLGGREAYQNVLYATPEDTNSLEDSVLSFFCQQARDKFRVDRTLEIFADMIPDASTADQLLGHLVRENTYRRYVVTFTTWINNIELEIADFVKIAHGLLPDSINAQTFEVIDKQFHPNGMLVTYRCAEIRQSQYSAWVERWEPPFNGIPSEIHTENWDAPPVPALNIFGDDGEVNRCNPFVELWEPSVTARDERLNYTSSYDDLGNDPVVLSESLIQAYDNGDWFDEVTPLTQQQIFTKVHVRETYPASADQGHQTTSYGFPLDMQTGANGDGIFGSGPTATQHPFLFINRDYDYLDRAIGLVNPVPGTGNQIPIELPTGGPGGHAAWQFTINSTDPANFRRRQRVRMYSGPRWKEFTFSPIAGPYDVRGSDWTLNFWVYQTQKGSHVRPFCSSRQYVPNSFQVENADEDLVCWEMWWNPNDDRYHLVIDYANNSGVTTFPDFSDLLDDMEANGNHVISPLGAPSLNTWYMHTLRYDYSTFTMDWNINGANLATIALGAEPNLHLRKFAIQISFMAANRWIHRANFLDKGPDQKNAYGMNGRLALIGNWGRRLVDDELTALYNSGSGLPFAEYGDYVP